MSMSKSSSFISNFNTLQKVLSSRYYASVVFSPFTFIILAEKNLGSRPGPIVKRVKQFCWF